MNSANLFIFGLFFFAIVIFSMFFSHFVKDVFRNFLTFSCNHFQSFYFTSQFIRFFNMKHFCTARTDFSFNYGLRIN